MINRIVKLVISVLYMIAYKIRCVAYHIMGEEVPSSFIILNYHSVQKTQVDRFRRQIDHLRRYHPVFADESIPLNNGRHYVAITFDDGYENIIENALPWLARREIPAMLFIPTGFMGKMPGWITNPENKNIDEPVMNEAQLRSLRTKFIKIGAHGVTHRNLTQLCEEEVMKELVDSKICLEELLDEKITSFAFPFGMYTNSVLSLVRKAGYSKIFCCWPSYPSSWTNEFLLGRVDASPDDWDLEFLLKVIGAYQWQPIGIVMKRGLAELLKTRTSGRTVSTG